jgi:hypothetical protein
MNGFVTNPLVRPSAGARLSTIAGEIAACGDRDDRRPGTSLDFHHISMLSSHTPALGSAAEPS